MPKMANVRIISHYLKEWGVIVQKSARRLEFSAVLAENSKRLADFRLVRFVCRGGFQDIFKVYPAVCYIDLSI